MKHILSQAVTSYRYTTKWDPSMTNMVVKTPDPAGVAIIVVPYHVGVANCGVGNGPGAILDAGLLPELERAGIGTNIVRIPPVDDFEGEIGRSFELLRRVSQEVTKAVQADCFPVVLAGNCHTSVAVVAGLKDPNLGIIWLDAHEDYHTPDTLESGYFDAMGVSMLVGGSWSALCEGVPGYRPMRVGDVVFCGLRDVTDAERRRVEDAPFRVVWGSVEKQVDFTHELARQLPRVAFRNVILHLDLDSLDSSIGKANHFAAPGGLLEHDLQGIIDLLRTDCPPAAMTVASFDPSLEGGLAIAAIAVRAICATVSAVVKPQN